MLRVVYHRLAGNEFIRLDGRELRFDRRRGIGYHTFAMNVALTKRQKEFIKARVDSGQYQDASEVVREALRVLENLEFDRDWLEAEIEKGIESGPPIAVNKDYWKNFRKRLHREHARRQREAA